MKALPSLSLIDLRQLHEPIMAVTAVGRLMRVHVASSFLARSIGLLNRGELGDDEGLLFVPGGSVHTLGMRFAIDVVFLSASVAVLKVATNVRPWRFALAPPQTRYVLEIRANRSIECGIVPGRSIEFA